MRRSNTNEWLPFGVFLARKHLKVTGLSHSQVRDFPLIRSRLDEFFRFFTCVLLKWIIFYLWKKKIILHTGREDYIHLQDIYLKNMDDDNYHRRYQKSGTLKDRPRRRREVTPTEHRRTEPSSEYWEHYVRTGFFFSIFSHFNSVAKSFHCFSIMTIVF